MKITIGIAEVCLIIIAITLLVAAFDNDVTL